MLGNRHIECSSDAVKTVFDLQVDGKREPGRPKMTWKQLTERDYREWKLSAIDPHDRHTWRSDVRSAMRVASQLPGRGPTDVDVSPDLHVNKKSDDDVDDDDELCITCGKYLFLWVLTLKVLSRFVADDILTLIVLFFRENNT